MTKILPVFCLAASLLACHQRSHNPVVITGELKQWHKITLMVTGPETAEYARQNPFLDTRLEVSFTHEKDTVVVPGFYAADGNAAETSSESGNCWMVRFRPHKTGTWNYVVTFREGKNIAVAVDPGYGKAVGADGASGHFEVAPSDKSGNDFRAKGRLENSGSRFLRFAGTGEWWIKNGADSPENFLAYSGFDQTYRYGEQSINREGEANPKQEIHHYKPHWSDWEPGDPTWQGEKGKTIIGAINYLAARGVNSQYMLTMNIIGDGKDVWPYNDHNERYRFDCSKLDQWEILFDHMEKKGIMLHFVLQETENECLLDMGHTGVQRKLYLRELGARFGHHLAVTWNLGEENGPAEWSPIGQTDKQRKEMASFLKSVNPYPSFVVIHTHSDDQKQDDYLSPLLGFQSLDGVSMQIGNPSRIHERIKVWIDRSTERGKPWIVNLDELGPSWKGIMPDSQDASHDTIRYHALWGALMAGAGGVEWYFGYRYPHNDLMLEDYRSREHWWAQSAIATNFFRKFLPFSEMKSTDHLLSGTEGFCFSKPGEIYAVYLPDGRKQASLMLEATGEFSVKWFNPRNGEDIINGRVLMVKGPGKINLGIPPSEPEKDWVILVKKINIQ
jgi:hypothetical protein